MRMRQVALSAEVMVLHWTMVATPGLDSKCDIPLGWPPHGALLDDDTTSVAFRCNGSTSSIAYHEGLERQCENTGWAAGSATEGAEVSFFAGGGGSTAVVLVEVGLGGWAFFAEKLSVAQSATNTNNDSFML